MNTIFIKVNNDTINDAEKFLINHIIGLKIMPSRWGYSLVMGLALPRLLSLVMASKSDADSNYSMFSCALQNS